MGRNLNRGVTFPPLNDREWELLNHIVDRAVALGAGGSDVSRLALQMKIRAVHEKTPLDLQALAVADDLDLIHDVAGINRFVDPGTGRLRDGFIPRTTRR